MHMCMVTEIIIYQLQLQEVLCHGYPSFIKVPDVHVWCPQEDTLAEDLSASVDPAVINFALEDLVLIRKQEDENYRNNVNLNLSLSLKDIVNPDGRKSDCNNHNHCNVNVTSANPSKGDTNLPSKEISTSVPSMPLEPSEVSIRSHSFSPIPDIKTVEIPKENYRSTIEESIHVTTPTISTVSLPTNQDFHGSFSYQDKKPNPKPVFQSNPKIPDSSDIFVELPSFDSLSMKVKSVKLTKESNISLTEPRIKPFRESPLTQSSDYGINLKIDTPTIPQHDNSTDITKTPSIPNASIPTLSRDHIPSSIFGNADLKNLSLKESQVDDSKIPLISLDIPSIHIPGDDLNVFFEPPSLPNTSNPNISKDDFGESRISVTGPKIMSLSKTTVDLSNNYDIKLNIDSPTAPQHDNSTEIKKTPSIPIASIPTLSKDHIPSSIFGNVDLKNLSLKESQVDNTKIPSISLDIPSIHIPGDDLDVFFEPPSLTISNIDVSKDDYQASKLEDAILKIGGYQKSKIQNSVHLSLNLEISSPNVPINDFNFETPSNPSTTDLQFSKEDSNHFKKKVVDIKIVDLNESKIEKSQATFSLDITSPIFSHESLNTIDEPTTPSCSHPKYSNNDSDHSHFKKEKPEFDDRPESNFEESKHKTLSMNIPSPSYTRPDIDIFEESPSLPSVSNLEPSKDDKSSLIEKSYEIIVSRTETLSKDTKVEIPTPVIENPSIESPIFSHESLNTIDEPTIPSCSHPKYSNDDSEHSHLKKEKPEFDDRPESNFEESKHKTLSMNIPSPSYTGPDIDIFEESPSLPSVSNLEPSKDDRSSLIEKSYESIVSRTETLSKDTEIEIPTPVIEKPSIESPIFSHESVNTVDEPTTPSCSHPKYSNDDSEHSHLKKEKTEFDDRPESNFDESKHKTLSMNIPSPSFTGPDIDIFEESPSLPSVSNLEPSKDDKSSLIEKSYESIVSRTETLSKDTEVEMPTPVIEKPSINSGDEISESNNSGHESPDEVKEPKVKKKKMKKIKRKKRLRQLWKRRNFRDIYKLKRRFKKFKELLKKKRRGKKTCKKCTDCEEIMECIISCMESKNDYSFCMRKCKENHEETADELLGMNEEDANKTSMEDEKEVEKVIEQDMENIVDQIFEADNEKTEAHIEQIEEKRNEMSDNQSNEHGSENEEHNHDATDDRYDENANEDQNDGNANEDQNDENANEYQNDENANEDQNDENANEDQNDENANEDQNDENANEDQNDENAKEDQNKENASSNHSNEDSSDKNEDHDENAIHDKSKDSALLTDQEKEFVLDNKSETLGLNEDDSEKLKEGFLAENNGADDVAVGSVKTEDTLEENGDHNSFEDAIMRAQIGHDDVNERKETKDLVDRISEGE